MKYLCLSIFLFWGCPQEKKDKVPPPTWRECGHMSAPECVDLYEDTL